MIGKMNLFIDGRCIIYTNVKIFWAFQMFKLFCINAFWCCSIINSILEKTSLFRFVYRLFIYTFIIFDIPYENAKAGNISQRLDKKHFFFFKFKNLYWWFNFIYKMNVFFFQLTVHRKYRCLYRNVVFLSWI